MPSEIAIHQMVESAKKQAKELGFMLDWYSQGWKINTGVNIVAGTTASELLFYLNGWQDRGTKEALDRQRNTK